MAGESEQPPNRSIPYAPIGENGWEKTRPPQAPKKRGKKWQMICVYKTRPNHSKFDGKIDTTNSRWRDIKGSDWLGYDTREEAQADALVCLANHVCCLENVANRPATAR